MMRQNKKTDQEGLKVKLHQKYITLVARGWWGCPLPIRRCLSSHKCGTIHIPAMRGKTHPYTT